MTTLDYYSEASCRHDCGCSWVHSAPHQRDPAWITRCDRHGDQGLSTWVHDDGGREAAGYRGEAGDCVARSIAIITGFDYQAVYDDLNDAAKRERPRAGRKRSSARNGVKTATIRRYLAELGFEWTPTMQIGSGCKVHLKADELPSGLLIVKCSGHVTAVINGVVHDTHDPSRDGTRCVYGYWKRSHGEED